LNFNDFGLGLRIGLFFGGGTKSSGLAISWSGSLRETSVTPREIAAKVKRLFFMDTLVRRQIPGHYRAILISVQRCLPLYTSRQPP